MFRNSDILKKGLKIKNSPGIFSRMMDFLFNNDKLYLAHLNEENRSRFFNTRDIGCFWHIFVLKDENKLGWFLDFINRNIIINDTHLENISDIPCAIYRDYLSNSLFLLYNENNISYFIEECTSKNNIPIFNKQIGNIFDTLYIDELPYKKIHE